MALKVCKNGHKFEKTSNCPVCPQCSSEEMNNAFGEEFPALGAPAFRALHGAGIKRLQDLTRFREKDLLALHGFGPKALRLLNQKLSENGMTFLEK